MILPCETDESEREQKLWHLGGGYFYEENNNDKRE